MRASSPVLAVDNLNRFMAREEFPANLRQRLRAYFHASKHLRLAEAQRSLLTHMPPSLQGEVSWMTHRVWLKSIKFLKHASARFMIELAMQLHPVVFTPNDVPPNGYLYIIQRGIVMYRGRVLTKGRTWGEDVILQTASLRLKALARALNFLEAYYQSRDELMALSKRHPETAHAIRQAAIWMALRREIIQLAKLIQHGGANPLERGQTSINRSAVDSTLEAAASGSLQGCTVASAVDLPLKFDILGNQIAEEVDQSRGITEMVLRQMTTISKALAQLQEKAAESERRDERMLSCVAAAMGVSRESLGGVGPAGGKGGGWMHQVASFIGGAPSPPARDRPLAAGATTPDALTSERAPTSTPVLTGRESPALLTVSAAPSDALDPSAEAADFYSATGASPPVVLVGGSPVGGRAHAEDTEEKQRVAELVRNLQASRTEADALRAELQSSRAQLEEMRQQMRPQEEGSSAVPSPTLAAAASPTTLAAAASPMLAATGSPSASRPGPSRPQLSTIPSPTSSGRSGQKAATPSRFNFRAPIRGAGGAAV